MLESFVIWFASLSIFDLFVVLLFPAVFDFSRSLGKILFFKFRIKKDELETEPFFKVHDPLISILIPAHNEESCIEDSIKAAMILFYPNLEIIVIDDCSTDNTYSIAKKYADKNQIKLLHKNTGGSKASALNLGLLHSKGDIIITTDADSQLEPHCIERIVRKFDDRDVMAVSGKVSIKGGDDGINNVLTKLQQYEYKIISDIGKRFFSHLNIILVVAGAFASFRREGIRHTGRFSQHTLCEDFHQSIRINMIKKAKIVYEPDAICHTHCPNNFRSLIQQRNRWSAGQLTTILQHKKILSCSAYEKRLRLAMWDMLLMDILLNFLGIIVIGVILVMVLVSIVESSDYTELENISYKLAFLYLVYLATELIVFGYLYRIKSVSLNMIYLVPIMMAYRPILKIISFRGCLKVLLGKKISW